METNILKSDGFALFNSAVSGVVGLYSEEVTSGWAQGKGFNFLAHKETTVAEEINTDGDCLTCHGKLKE